MKLQLKSVLCVSLLAACIASVVPPVTAQVAAVAPAAPVQVQYRIVTAGPAPDGKMLEEEINRLAAQGWRVRTSIMAGVVMEKE